MAFLVTHIPGVSYCGLSDIEARSLSPFPEAIHVAEDSFLKQAAPGLKLDDIPDKLIASDIGGDCSQSKPVDGRRSPRHAISASGEVVEPRSRTRLGCRATDLSAGGCYLDMINPFPVGTDVHLRFASDGRIFQTEAHVLYATPGMGMGVAFTKTAPSHQAVLTDWMRALGDDAPLPEATSGDFDFEAEISPTIAPSVSALVTELVALLARKKLLTDAEAQDFKKKLSQASG